jgi:hypothetical protein
VIVVKRGCEDGCCQFDYEGPFDTEEDAELYAESKRDSVWWAYVTTVKDDAFVMDPMEPES